MPLPTAVGFTARLRLQPVARYVTGCYHVGVQTFNLRLRAAGRWLIPVGCSSSVYGLIYVGYDFTVDPTLVVTVTGRCHDLVGYDPTATRSHALPRWSFDLPVIYATRIGITGWAFTFDSHI